MAANRNRARQGLTLMELLVVIGIVSLLAALLLPAVRRTVARADQAACAGNIHQIILGLQAYAHDHDGGIPYGDETMNAAVCYYIWDSERKWHLLGKLIENRTLDDPRVLYCPGQSVRLLSYPGGWRGFRSRERVYKASGYYYRLFGQLKPGIPREDIEAMRRWRLSMLTNEVALVADIFGNYGSPPGRSWAHRSPPGVNVGFFDGHVAFVAVAEEDVERAMRYNEGSMKDKSYIRDPFVHEFWRALESGDFSEIRRRWP